MMPTIEETVTPDIQAQIEHQEWEREREERGGRVISVEAVEGRFKRFKEFNR